MWRKATVYLVLASLGLNLAFVGVWVAHAWPALAAGEMPLEPAIWCPLHRALEVSPQQWAEIEPRLCEFQAAVGELCSHIDLVRSEVIDLIAAEEPDLDAIHAKQEEILATKRQIQRLVVEHLLAEKEVLTSEQQQRLFAMLRDRTGCAAEPPMSGRPCGGLGRVLQHRDATPPDDVNR
jgi:Spy/CpxP family protein refolding chaperone